MTVQTWAFSNVRNCTKLLRQAYLKDMLLKHWSDHCPLAHGSTTRTLALLSGLHVSPFTALAEISEPCSFVHQSTRTPLKKGSVSGDVNPTRKIKSRTSAFSKPGLIVRGWIRSCRWWHLVFACLNVITYITTIVLPCQPMEVFSAVRLQWQRMSSTSVPMSE